jgi:hypothetical protein
MQPYFVLNMDGLAKLASESNTSDNSTIQFVRQQQALTDHEP